MSFVDPRFSHRLSLTIPGDPHGKGSVRVVDTGKTKARKGPRWWLNPKKTKKRGIQSDKSKDYEDKIAALASIAYAGEPLEGLVMIRILSVKNRPKRPHRLSVPVDEASPDGRLFCPVTPDYDNIAKSVGDGLKKGRVLKDDATICRALVDTLYAATGDKPHVQVELYSIDR